uniref:Uncharacterized protein n=1 Tax=viral metagenome TaxID=1070528 RepID=A0A6C0J9B0_9ZZZZ
MGIIVNDVFEDSRGFTSNQTYASFSNSGMRIMKQGREYYVDISQEDASGNTNATPYKKELIDASGNKTINVYGNILTETLYRERRTKNMYFISSQLIQYKDKQSRLDNKTSIGSYSVNIEVELTEFADIFSKLYEKVKTDKTLFPFNNLTDDL